MYLLSQYTFLETIFDQQQKTIFVGKGKAPMQYCPCIFISTLKLWLYMVYFTQRNQPLYSLSYFKSILAYETILKHI